MDPAGNLYVADGISDSGANVNDRVLEYDNPLTTDTAADRVFGQAGSFTTGDCNLGLNPSADSLCHPRGMTVDAAGNLYVADLNNNRVLEYDNPLTTDTVADRVFGQAGSFTSNTCNLGPGISASRLCGPTGVTVDEAVNLYVADTQNHRVLEYNNPLTTDTVADRVFGQAGSFTSNTCNLGGISASSLCEAFMVAVDAAGRLYVADQINDRVLEYDCADADTDTICDSSDNCPNWPNPAQNLPAWSVPAGDPDCDGFPSTVAAGGRASESFMGTLPLVACSPTVSPDHAPDEWPVDFNNDQAANLTDIFKIVPHLNTLDTDPGSSQRFDLNGDGSINLTDIFKVVPFLNFSCAP